jgi:hypothetical protein
MDEDQLFLCPAKPPPAGICEDEYLRAEDMAFIKAQLTRMPAVIARAALGIIFSTAAVTTPLNWWLLVR